MTSQLRLAHGVWSPMPEPDLHEVVAALLCACPPGTVVCGLTAAHLHGLWLPPGEPFPIEVVVHPDKRTPRHRAHGRRSEVVTHRYVLDPEDITYIGGLPVTTPGRTWVDLARRLPAPDLVAAGDSVLRNGTLIDDLAGAVRRARRRVGYPRAKQLLPLLHPRSRSRPESHLRFAIVAGGLPTPKVNVPIYTSTGEWLAEPDLSYDDVRLALEYNGSDHAKVDRMRRDITRELDIWERGGWLTAVFGAAEVFRRPSQIPLMVARLRRERGARDR